MAYSIKYFFEEDADRVDGLLIEDVARAYGDCKIKRLESDVKVDIKHLNEDDSIIAFCEVELVCETIESFELVIAQIETKYGLVPYKTGYGESDSDGWQSG
jgi:hypothetical protein